MNQPHWVVFGMREIEGGVIILASSDLYEGSFDTKYDWEPDPFRPDGLYRFDRMRCRLEVEGLEFIRVIGPDYESALRTLFTGWSPPATEPAQLEERKP